MTIRYANRTNRNATAEFTPRLPLQFGAMSSINKQLKCPVTPLWGVHWIHTNCFTILFDRGSGWHDPFDDGTTHVNRVIL